MQRSYHDIIVYRYDVMISIIVYKVDIMINISLFKQTHSLLFSKLKVCGVGGGARPIIRNFGKKKPNSQHHDIAYLGCGVGVGLGWVLPLTQK